MARCGVWHLTSLGAEAESITEVRNQQIEPKKRGDSPFVRKLGHFAPLTAMDKQVLDELSGPDIRFPVHVDFMEEGVMPRSVMLLKEGMAMRYRSLPDGSRQIMTFLIPGDLCDMHVFLLKAMDHSIGTMTPVVAAPISRESMMRLFFDHPRISAALW